jgi:hypothetical protein
MAAEILDRVFGRSMVWSSFALLTVLYTSKVESEVSWLGTWGPVAETLGGFAYVFSWFIEYLGLW